MSPLEILAHADVEEIVQPQRVVDAKRQVALQSAGRARARIVDRRDDGPRFAALHVKHDVAFAGYVGRHDPHRHVLARHALHLLEALFEIAQVQQLAVAGRKGGLPGTSECFVGETYVTDHAGDQR
ncbi:hypothetical protein VP95_28595 [Burkholderia pseudomallei]|nr:hypothetical protein VP95_28595 [Burkholderia pseudomallei]OND57323.1 hypothetical protein AQ936_17240 [Burkholderia pseudomallei]OND63124.1 hypothetical protein AQ937_07630 [Burkholderia pseudomallei]OND85914.1 hypothetical protein AQ940_25410 [Burkholderia pseudomallei]OND88038.1 hypothetical protein AQ939_14285 [Burkholderia pseudomallei]